MMKKKRIDRPDADDVQHVRGKSRKSLQQEVSRLYIPPNLQNAYADFALHNLAARLSSKTHEFYRCQLIQFLDWCGSQGVDDLADISPPRIRAYLADRQQRQLSDHSLHAAARAIRAFLNFCVRDRHIATSPMEKVAMPRVHRQVLPAFTFKQVRQLLRACNGERERSIVLCLLDTGCRASEFVELKWGDIDLGLGEVRIRKGKGRKPRTVFLGIKARESLTSYLCEEKTVDADCPVWCNRVLDSHLTSSGLHQLLKRIGARANVAHCGPHTFRRTFAIECLRNGMDIFRLARLMGHSDISVLRHYLDLLKDDLRAAHAQFGAVDRLLDT